MNYILKDMCQEYDFRNNILKIGYHFTSSLIHFEKIYLMILEHYLTFWNFKSTECEKKKKKRVTYWDNLIQVKPKALLVFFLVLILLCVSQEEFA